MRYAIFFAIARDAKIEVRIGQLGRATNRAFVKRFGFAAGLIFKAFPPTRNFLPVPRSIKTLRPKENQVIG